MSHDDQTPPNDIPSDQGSKAPQPSNPKTQEPPKVLTPKMDRPRARDFQPDAVKPPCVYKKCLLPFLSGVAAVLIVAGAVHGVLWMKGVHPLQVVRDLHNDYTALQQKNVSLQTRIDALSNDLATLQNRTSALETSQNTGKPAQSDDVLSRVVPALEHIFKQSINALTEPLSQKVSDLQKTQNDARALQSSSTQDDIVPLTGLMCLDHIRRCVDRGQSYTQAYTPLIRVIQKMISPQSSLQPSFTHALKVLETYQTQTIPTVASLMDMPRQENVLFENLPNGFMWMKHYIHTDRDMLQPQHHDILSTLLNHGDLAGATQFVRQHMARMTAERDPKAYAAWNQWLMKANVIQALSAALDSVETFLMQQIGVHKTVTAPALINAPTPMPTPAPVNVSPSIPTAEEDTADTQDAMIDEEEEA